MMKHIRNVMAAGICYGILLILLKTSFNMSDRYFWQFYWILAAIIVGGAVIFDFVYQIVYQKRIDQVLPLLDENPQEFILEMEKLLKNAKGRQLKNVITLNLAAGYMETSQFDKAIPMLEELSVKPMRSSSVKAAHRINLCMSYFETEAFDKAMKMYEDSQRLFQRYRNSKIYGANIALLDIFAAIQMGNDVQAERILQNEERKTANPRLRKAFQEAAKLLEVKKEM